MGQVRGAGLRHAWVRLADGTYHDIDAVVSLEGDLEIDETTVEGDDQALANFASKPTKSISITANSLSTPLLAAITGRAEPTDVMSTGGSPTKIGEEIGLGGSGEQNPPYVEVGGYTVGRLKADDTAQTIQHIFHRCQLRLTSSPQEKDGEFNCEFEGIAYPSTTDITGEALAYERTDTLRYTDETVEELETAQAA